jgi:hypothetical protein
LPSHAYPDHVHHRSARISRPWNGRVVRVRHIVGDLGHGEHVNEIEEELEGGGGITLACRVSAAVEAAVQVAERWVLAPLRNHRFFSLAEANAAIAEHLRTLTTAISVVRTSPG